ncbi:PEP motif putative anchor domain protein [Gemmatirosa kalamazoonensis]|uniref:PEP motif putative anchor domain protein n=1 Tax=Gemmatirosa kalamazoonensis TaxID=861299 RepID=W0RGM2_9BACT|nr:hypothetical protein [Gemmatirosa kalamazoonensis]AHG89931.1 PEP motif putative anchor domain protein [Gemmatirosa kalamazoonensis]
MHPFRIRWRRRGVAIGVAVGLLLCVTVATVARADPITLTAVLIGLASAIIGGIAVNNATSVYLALSLGYATPQPDASVSWRTARNDPAIAVDFDTDPQGKEHLGEAVTTIGLLFDRLDPIANSHGSYYNASRIFKNGSVAKESDGGALPPGTPLDAIRFTAGNLPLTKDFSFDINTGKIGSIDALVGGGALYDGTQWVPWDPRTVTEPVVHAFLDGALTPGPAQGVPFNTPSTDQLFDENDADGAVNWFPYFLAAVNAAGTHVGSDGRTYTNEFSFDVPFGTGVTTDGSWYISEEALAPGQGPGVVVPEPVSVTLVGVGLCAIGVGARVRRRMAPSRV